MTGSKKKKNLFLLFFSSFLCSFPSSSPLCPYPCPLVPLILFFLNVLDPLSNRSSRKRARLRTHDGVWMTFWRASKVQVLLPSHALLLLLLLRPHLFSSRSSPPLPGCDDDDDDDDFDGASPETSADQQDFLQRLTQLSALGAQERGDDIDDFLDQLETSFERCGLFFFFSFLFFSFLFFCEAMTSPLIFPPLKSHQS